MYNLSIWCIVRVEKLVKKIPYPCYGTWRDIRLCPIHQSPPRVPVLLILTLLLKIYVITAVIVEVYIFWDVTLCSVIEVYRHDRDNSLCFLQPEVLESVDAASSNLHIEVK